MRISAPISNKVPAITAVFWIAKVLSTSMGEDASDWLNRRLGDYPSVLLGFGLFIVALYLQFSSTRFNKWRYWFAVCMVALFGTMAADVLHKGMGIPYLATSIGYLVLLISIFAIWHRVESDLSFSHITTTRREVFYWLTVSTTFALGTAVGDLTAHTFGWGFLASGIIFAIAFALPGIAYGVARTNSVMYFWLAYVLTRPFGASFADWFAFSKSAKPSGLGWGYGWPTLALSFVITLVVAFSKEKAVD